MTRMLLNILLACHCGAENPDTPGGRPQDSPDRARESFVDISIGDTFACGVRTDGTLRCWGASELAPGGHLWARVEQYDDYTCALDLTGQACCWGAAELAGDCSDRGTAYPADTFVDLTTGLGYACGLTANNQILCWGADAGIGTLVTEWEDVPIIEITAMYGLLVAHHGGNMYSSWDVASSFPGVRRFETRVSVELDSDDIVLVDHDANLMDRTTGRVLPYNLYAADPGAVRAEADHNALCARYPDGHIRCEAELSDTGHYAEQFSADPDPEERFTDFALWHNISYGATGCGLLEGTGHVKCWGYVLPPDPMFRHPP